MNAQFGVSTQTTTNHIFVAPAMTPTTYAAHLPSTSSQSTLILDLARCESPVSSNLTDSGGSRQSSPRTMKESGVVNHPHRLGESPATTHRTTSSRPVFTTRSSRINTINNTNTLIWTLTACLMSYSSLLAASVFICIVIFREIRWWRHISATCNQGFIM